MTKKKYIRALTIAGSDSSGGAGIQADLKTFSALGCYGMTVITSVTAQNTLGVQGIYDLPPEAVKKQLVAVLDDIGIDVIKIGMLHRSEIIDEVSSILSKIKENVPIVVDPVMVSKSGHLLLAEDAIENLKAKIFPLATMITPNLPEASKLLGKNIVSQKDMELSCQELCKMGPKSTVIKGGHMEGTNKSQDCLWEKDKTNAVWVESIRINTDNTHGTGCTFSSAIAAYLGKGKSIQESVSLSKDYLFNALSAGAEYKFGKGCGPVHHFFAMWL